LEETMSQVSTARVSTVLGTQSFHNPLSMVPPFHHSRAVSQPPMRGLSCSPNMECRNTILRQTHVATAYDMDVLGNQVEKVIRLISEKGVCACKAPEPRDSLEEKTKASAKLRSEPTDICTLRLAIRAAEEAEVTEKEIETYRNKLAEMERTEKEEQTRKDEELFQMQTEVANLKTDNQSLNYGNQTLRSGINQLELENRRKEKQIETTSQRMEDARTQHEMMQKKSGDLEAEIRNLKAEIDQINKQAELKCSKLTSQNRILLHHEKENIQQVQKANAEHQSLQSKVSEEIQQGKTHLSSLEKQLRESETSKGKMSEYLLDLERKLSVKSLSTSSARPAEIFRMMRSDDNVNREIQALQSRCAYLESLNKVAQAQHQVLWSFVPKEAEVAVEQKLRAMKAAPRY